LPGFIPKKIYRKEKHMIIVQPHDSHYKCSITEFRLGTDVLKCFHGITQLRNE
jgi:hypothetical protein